MLSRPFRILLLVILSTGAVAHADRLITTPKEQFGFNLGDDYHLANYKQLTEYWTKLDKESDRMKVVPVGVTEEGRTMLMAIITSPGNHRRLKKYQETSRRLCLAEEVSEEEARKLAKDGKAVVWIDGGLHASETLGAQQLMETVYQLVSGNDAETKRILNDVIVLAVLANPDGQDLVADWYMRNPDPKKRSLAGLPRLYQKYIGHDNNRDFYASTQKETEAMNRVMYHEWFPQIVYNHHQTGPPGTVLFMPPFRDPFNYNFDPLVPAGIDLVGAAMQNRFLVENKPGATTRSGSRYSTWWNGGLRTTCYFHNMIGLLTETIGSPTPMRIPFIASKQVPKQDLIAPVDPQEWHFRQSVDYSVTANKAVLDLASRHKEQFLYNTYRMGRNSIERGSRDSWTPTPKRIAAAQSTSPSPTALRERGPGGEGRHPLRKPEWRDPRGYILPADQPDFLTAIKYVNALMETGITVHRAKEAFEVGGNRYPAGSLIVKCAQAFRPHILDMFEPQDHPDDFAYPGGPPIPPYDSAGWTLAYQMGLQFDRILDGFDGPFEKMRGPAKHEIRTVPDSDGTAGYLLDHRVNDSFTAVNALLAAGVEVYWLKSPLQLGAMTRPPGTMYIPATTTATSKLPSLAAEVGLSFDAVTTPPPGEAFKLKPIRIGLWDRYGGSMPSGWTRWLFEQFNFPFTVVYPPTLDAGSLRDKFDVLVFPDGAIPGAGPVQSPTPDSGDSEPRQREPDPDESNIPAEYRGRRGSVTAQRTVPQIKKFLEEGGIVVAIGSSTGLARMLGLPVSDHLVETVAGRERRLSREKFYVPGSVLSVRVDNTHPLAYGMGERADVMFVNSPVMRLGPDAQSAGVKQIAWFDGPAPLRSGWAWGQKVLEGGAAAVEASVGKGKLILFGPEVAFRAQPHGTFKLLFNALYYGTAESVMLK
jgi:hypothetical protein